jgi:transposase
MNPVVEVPAVVETEVTEKAKRRTFTAEYKKRILEEADRALVSDEAGGVGALLRREGLYSSHLVEWRRLREAGELSGLSPKRRGPAPRKLHPLEKENAELKRKLERAEARAKRAEAVIEVQKKVSELLGIPLPPRDGES